MLALNVNLWVYFAFTIIGTFSIFGLAFAYIADTTTVQERSKWYGLLLVAVYLALILGAIPSLFLSRRAVCICAGVSCFFVLAYVIMYLPESLHAEAYAHLNDDHHHDDHHAGEHTRAHADTDGMATVDLDGNAYQTGPVPQKKSSADQAGNGVSVAAAAASTSGDAGGNGGGGNNQITVNGQKSMTNAPISDMNAPAHSEFYQPLAALRFAVSTKFMLYMSLTVLFSQLAEIGILNTIFLYLKKEMDFTKDNLAGLLMVVGMSSLLSMVFVYPPLLKHWGEKKVIVFSVVANMIRVLLYLGLKKKWQVYLLECFSGFGLMSFAGMRVHAMQVLNRSDPFKLVSYGVS